MNPMLLRLLRELKPYKKLLVIIAIGGLAMSLSQAQFAVQMKDLFNALEKKDVILIKRVPLIVLALALIQSVGRYFHMAYMNYLSDVVAVDLRQQLQAKFMRLNQSFHGNYREGSGGLISRILSDIGVIQNGLKLVGDLFTAPLQFVLLLGYVLYLDWQLTLMILIALPVLASFSRSIGKSMRKYGHSSQGLLENVTGVVKESLDGVRVIQSFVLEQEMSKRFRSLSNEYLAARKKIHLRGEAAGPVTELVAIVVIMIIFTYVGLRIAANQASFGDFGGYLGALLLMQQPIRKLQESYVKLQETIVATGRIYEILDDPREVLEIPTPRPFPEKWQTIEFKHVSFSYKEDRVLKDVQLTIRRGETVALVGESGSGKSTMVSLLQRFFDPTVGEITIDGVSLREYSIQDLRRNIGLVTQEVFLFNESVARNIQAGDFRADDSARVQSSARMAFAADFIERMPQSYETRVGERGNLLSGGEKQRISIARAIFKDAPILVLDEATSALDSQSEQEVQRGLDNLLDKNTKGRTTIVIAHRLSTVLHAQKIVVMKSGEIKEVGTHLELIKASGEYAQFIALQNLH